VTGGAGLLPLERGEEGAPRLAQRGKGDSPQEA
jgi:hypothetical protein